MADEFQPPQSQGSTAPSSYQAIVQQIRERVDIVSLIGRHVQLKRAGSSFKACCPFHQEKTPSFHVHPDKQFFYCFGCGAKGDAFGFLMDYEGKRFPEVIQDLADEMGIAMPETSYGASLNPEEDQKKEKLYQLNHWAKQLFTAAREGPEGKFVREYLEGRGISAEMIEAFGIGYAPDGWSSMVEFLESREADLALAEEIGLIKQAENSDRRYDRFRHRLMFPIVLSSGRIAGYGGRVLRDDDGAKYLNSPESPIFQKSHLLYGIDLAGPTIRRGGHAILCEGYLDVISMHQYGFAQTIAALGTALNENHLYQLKRHTKRVVLLFDGDKAGIKAAERALQVLLPGGLSIDILLLPDGEDPDTYLRKHGSAAMETLIADQVQSAFDFWLEHLRSRANENPVALRDASQEVLELVQKVGDPILRDLYLKRASALLNIEEVQMRRGLMRVVPRASATTRNAAPDAQQTLRTDSNDERLLREQEVHFRMIKIVLENPDLFPFVVQAEMTRGLRDPVLREAWSQLISDLQEGGSGPALLDAVLESLAPMPHYQRSLARWLMKEQPYEGEEEDLHIQWLDLARQIEIFEVESQLQHVTQALEEAWKNDESELCAKFSTERATLNRRRLELRKNVCAPIAMNAKPWAFPPPTSPASADGVAEYD